MVHLDHRHRAFENQREPTHRLQQALASVLNLCLRTSLSGITLSDLIPLMLAEFYHQFHCKQSQDLKERAMIY